MHGVRHDVVGILPTGLIKQSFWACLQPKQIIVIIKSIYAKLNLIKMNHIILVRETKLLHVSQNAFID